MNRFMRGFAGGAVGTLAGTAERLGEAGVLCNDAELLAPSEPGGTWEVAGDPTEGALLTLGAKAGIDRGQLVKAVDRHAAAQRLADEHQPVGRRDRDCLRQVVVRHRDVSGFGGICVQPESPLLEGTDPLLEALGDVRPIDIASPTDCICVPSSPDVPGSFSNAQRGIFVTT